MKLAVKSLIFLLVVFFLNILFYFLSEDYRFFIEKMKYRDIAVETQENPYDEEEIRTYEDVLETAHIVRVTHSEPAVVSTLPDEDIQVVQKTEVLGKNYKDILSEFRSLYGLKNIEVNARLFEITDEYPDYYYEYYSPLVTLYFFPSRSYEEIFDMFLYLEKDLPFGVNRVKNFGEDSFYINLDEDIADGFVRLVIFDNGVTFGLKIKKDEYNKVKDLLLK